MLQHLGAEERADQHQKGADQHHAGNLGPFPDPVGIEAVHASSRIENQARKVISTRSANPAVVRAWSGL